MIWRPAIQETNDGSPLAVHLGDMLWNFPYDKLQEENKLISYFLRPEVMVLWLAMYWTSKALFKKMVSHWWEGPMLRKTFQIFVAIHNLALAVFSLVVACNTWAIVGVHIYEKGLYATYSDSDGSLWREGFGA